MEFFGLSSYRMTIGKREKFSIVFFSCFMKKVRRDCLKFRKQEKMELRVISWRHF